MAITDTLSVLNDIAMMRKYESVMKAAGDPTRARILKMLEGGEICVCDMIEILGLSQSTVSGHLAVLKKAGLITDRKKGRWAYYSLIDRKQNAYALPLLALLLGWLDDDTQVSQDKEALAALRLKQGESSCT